MHGVTLVVPPLVQVHPVFDVLHDQAEPAQPSVLHVQKTSSTPKSAALQPFG
jgi:hypothetical protein